MKSIDIRDYLWYSKYMRQVRHKSITLPVLPGATPAWVKAQRNEMVSKLVEELPSGAVLRIRKQWTDKAEGRWMTVIADYYVSEDTDDTTS